MFNERTRTAFNDMQFPTDMVMLVVLWRIRYKFSLRDLAEIFAVRGYELLNQMKKIAQHVIANVQDHVKQWTQPLKDTLVG